MKQFTTLFTHAMAFPFHWTERHSFNSFQILKNFSYMKNLNTLIILALAFSFSIATAQTAPGKQWDARFGGSSDDYLTSLQQTADGGYILGGYSTSGISGDKTQASQGGYDYWIVKTDAGAITTETMFDPEDFFSEIYPNPVQNQLTIKMAIPASEVTIRVYDLQGKMIDLPATIQNMQAQINTNALPDGFYTLQITNNITGNSEVRKFVKQE